MMRQIVAKCAGKCRKCGVDIQVGDTCIHERRVGVFCVECAPSDTEEIREVRQEAADRKAGRLEEWAAKRREKAAAVYKSQEWARGDFAFCTQPGRIPMRDRMNRQLERAFESEKKADAMEARAASMRNVRIAGDAERAREERREKARAWVKKGMVVNSPMWGNGVVTRVNKKTVTMAPNRLGPGRTVTEGLQWIKFVSESVEA